jgi:CBS domain-containing protein
MGDSRDATPTTLADIMSPDPITLDADESLRNAVDLLGGRGISGAPVTSRGRVVGVVSMSDILAFQASMPGVPTEQPEHADWGEWEDAVEWVEGEEPPPAYFMEYWDDAGAPVDARLGETSGPEWDALTEHTVSEVMTRTILALPPDISIRTAAGFMAKHGIHRVLVMEGERLVGIVSSMDILRAVGEGAVC